ncbi:MAG: hypothetical protein E4H13_10785 [Calditrichales bacterium]|nr:MAG: hypothetical protein E4H13_10785 [Calditrichales bacterium]
MSQSIEKSGLTLRAVLIAVFLSLFLLMSTSYIALKMGAAPWPIIFSVIVSGAIIKLLNRGKHVNIHEVNVAQAGGSIGGLIAAGMAFTLPGILYLNISKGMNLEMPEPWLLSILIATAGVLGILLSVPLKYTFIDEENLPFPAGTAGAELLKLGDTGGRRMYILVIIGSLVAIFTLARDIYFPSGFVLFSLASLGISMVLIPLPIALGAGYILGPRPGLSWLAGAVIGWYLIIPLLHLGGGDAAHSGVYMKNLGMGMVLGAGVSFFILYILPRIKKIFMPFFKTNRRLKYAVPLTLFAGMVSLYLNALPLPAILLTLIGVWAMVAVAARMTGETNIDPLEQLGIFVTIMIAAVYTAFSLPLPVHMLFVIVVFVSVACAVAGDAGHDYKSAALIGTKFSDIVKVDIITVIVTGLAAPFVFELIRQAFANTLFTEAMPAPQAQLVAGSIIGFEHPEIFVLGFAVAFLGEMINHFLTGRLKNMLMWMPFGIGLFLGPGLALPLAIGAIVNIWIQRKKPELYHSGILLAAGIMGAEGIAGFSAGAFTVSGLNLYNSSLMLAVLFLLVGVASTVLLIRKRNLT